MQCHDAIDDLMKKQQQIALELEIARGEEYFEARRRLALVNGMLLDNQYSLLQMEKSRGKRRE